MWVLRYKFYIEVLTWRNTFNDLFFFFLLSLQEVYLFFHNYFFFSDYETQNNRYIKKTVFKKQVQLDATCSK